MILSSGESVSSSVAEADGLVEKMRKEMNLIKGVKVLDILLAVMVRKCLHRNPFGYFVATQMAPFPLEVFPK